MSTEHARGGQGERSERYVLPQDASVAQVLAARGLVEVAISRGEKSPIEVRNLARIMIGGEETPWEPRMPQRPTVVRRMTSRLRPPDSDAAVVEAASTVSVFAATAIIGALTTRSPDVAFGAAGSAAAVTYTVNKVVQHRSRGRNQ